LDIKKKQIIATRVILIRCYYYHCYSRCHTCSMYNWPPYLRRCLKQQHTTAPRRTCEVMCCTFQSKVGRVRIAPNGTVFSLTKRSLLLAPRKMPPKARNRKPIPCQFKSASNSSNLGNSVVLVYVSRINPLTSHTQL
jgi:hypothetical protein